jgi:hypothetical protein
LTHNTDVVIGTESWLSEEIKNAKVFRDDYMTLRGIGILEVVECSFVLKITSIAGNYGLLMILR